MSFNSTTVFWFGSAVGYALLLPVVTRRRMPTTKKLETVSETKVTEIVPSQNGIPQQQIIAKTNNRKALTTLQLDPNAMEFVPCIYSAQMQCLSPITEEHWKQQPLYPSHNILRCKYIVFIAAEFTKNAIKDNLFSEYFESDSDLFYHLRYQCKMQVIDGYYKLFRCDDHELAVFNTELHCCSKGIKQHIFIIAHPNDKDKQNAARWQMIQFMTASQIYEKYNINRQDLPCGSRLKLYQKFETQMSEFKRDINVFRNSLTMDKVKRMNRIAQIKALHTVGRKKKKMIVSCSQLLDCIGDSIERNELRPIIWFDKKKNNRLYQVQMLLRIELEKECFGITFDYDDRKQLFPVKLCIDDVDIRRKLALYKPAQDEKDYAVFSNNISEIHFMDDADKELIWKQKKKIKSLQSVIRAKDEEIEKLIKKRFQNV